MINLLNPAEIRELTAARINVRLRRFAILTFCTIVTVGGIYAFSFYKAAKEYNDAVAMSQTSELALKDYSTVKTTAKEYQSNLVIAKKILGSEITFSKFITDLATSLPPNTILDSLSLSTKSIGVLGGKPITTQLTARAKGYNDVLALKTNLEKKTDLFSQVRITSTSLSTTASGDALTKAYPYAVTFSVVIPTQGTTK